MKNYGLIGRNISYSFSKKYFTEKFRKLFLKNYSYEIFDIDNIESLENIIIIQKLSGFNVTTPYKETIIPYLDELSDEAKKIGAVNTVKIIGGKKIGYNTDAFGFEKTLLLQKDDRQTSALVLGNGGAAKAVKYILEKYGISHQTVSRSGELTFDSLTEEIVAEHPIIIQCTPVGTSPDVNISVKFPFGALTENHLVIDLIYNPECTLFLKKAQENGAKTANGYYMLEQQAEKAWEIWNSEKNNLI